MPKPVKLSDQRTYLAIARRVVQGAKRDIMREAERDLVLESIDAAIATIALLEQNEAAFREFLQAKKASAS